MQLIEDLHAQHRLIEAVAGSLRTWSKAWAGGEGREDDGRAFLRFFRRWAGDFHHAREESVLFEALVKDLGLPRARGPIAVITRDHVELAGLLDELEAALGRPGDEARRRVDELAVAYSRHLWHHIDAEDSVLFPESDVRLARAGRAALAGRPPTADELAAKDDGEALVARFAPLVDPDVFRGEGCILCPAYGVTCDGLEREWWNESEWEEIHDRLTNM